MESSLLLGRWFRDACKPACGERSYSLQMLDSRARQMLEVPVDKTCQPKVAACAGRPAQNYVPIHATKLINQIDVELKTHLHNPLHLS